MREQTAANAWVPDLQLTEATRQDLDRIWKAIAERNGEGTADRILREFTRVFRHIADFPRIGRPDSRLPAGMLTFTHSRWRILYLVTGGSVPGCWTALRTGLG